jgi:hypothetical protein
MELTQDFKQTITARVRRDPPFGRALMNEAAELFLSGEPEIAGMMLRDVVNPTVGFEEEYNAEENK